MVFEEHNLKKSSIVWENEHNFSIIWPKKEQRYWHNMLLLLAQTIKASGYSYKKNSLSLNGMTYEAGIGDNSV